MSIRPKRLTKINLNKAVMAILISGFRNCIVRE